MPGGGFGKLTVGDLDVRGRRPLVRVDFNVPVQDGRVVDATRIAAAVPTIKYLTDRGCPVVLMSHLGRPKGKPNPAMSLRPVAAVLAEHLGMPVAFIPDALGPAAEGATAALRPGQVALLENVRFYPGDEANDTAMAQALARHGDLYVNDAFGAAHRAHASTSGVAAFLPAVAGWLMERELSVLGDLLAAPARPFLVILAGAKISDKFAVIRSMLGKCDVLALGGGMANAFLAANGLEVGQSLIERERIPDAAALMAEAAAAGVKILLPVDRVIAADLKAGVAHYTVPVDKVPSDMAAFDIGPASVEQIAVAAARAGTVFWNGPVGVYELPEFAAGTLGIARAVAAATAHGAVTVAAGGDSLAVVNDAGVAQQFTHLSTGGGATLELLEGKPLPGVECLASRSTFEPPVRKI